mgnify:CR=1 FL=1
MNQITWFPFLLAFYAVISTFGLYLLKAAQEVQSFNFAVGAFCYGSGFIIWLFILRMYPLSVAFPAAAGTLIVATQVAGIVYLGEKANLTALIGSGFIILGIILMYITMAKS